MTIDFFISGQPIPKGRPRVINGVAHTPERTKTWETRIGWEARIAGVMPLEGDLAVTLHFQRQGTGRADLDNLVKSVADGLNGIAYADDTQIVRLTASVEYGSKAPGVNVKIERITP